MIVLFFLKVFLDYHILCPLLLLICLVSFSNIFIYLHFSSETLHLTFGCHCINTVFSHYRFPINDLCPAFIQAHSTFLGYKIKLQKLKMQIPRYLRFPLNILMIHLRPQLKNYAS
uniref:Secreted protein n=1 Tax=Heterorhabditis bacteriophora TaxID=37862 RepID=A0A1I7WX35_HETBA